MEQDDEPRELQRSPRLHAGRPGRQLYPGDAARLGLAQSGISRTIRDLEARLGVQLLVRTTRSLSLTQAGEQLYRTALSSFQSLDAGLATLAHFRDTPSGTVRINASQHAIDKVLLPKLAIFRQHYPDIRLELISESRFVNIIDERFDAGVRLGGEVDEGMVAVRITPDMEMVMVATPDHFLQYGFPQTPAELATTPLHCLPVCRWQPLSVGAVAGGQTRQASAAGAVGLL